MENKVILSRIKLILGILFWIGPLYLLLLQMSLFVERVMACISLFSGVGLYFLVLYLRVKKCKSVIIELVKYNFVIVPLCLLVYFIEWIIIELISVEIYGLPTDVF